MSRVTDSSDFGRNMTACIYLSLNIYTSRWQVKLYAVNCMYISCPIPRAELRCPLVQCRLEKTIPLKHSRFLLFFLLLV